MFGISFPVPINLARLVFRWTFEDVVNSRTVAPSRPRRMRQTNIEMPILIIIVELRASLE